MSNCVNIAMSAPMPAAFNFLPWREWHQAARRRRRRLLWVAGCVAALLPGLWLQLYYHAENQSKLIAYTQSQANNHIRARQIEELAFRQGVIEERLAAIMLDRQATLRWSALANLMRTEHLASSPVFHELSLNHGQLTLYGQSSDASDLELLGSKADRLFEGEYALREVRRQHGLFHFQMEVPWTGGGTLSSSSSAPSPSPSGGATP